MRLTHCLVLLLVASHGLLVSSQWTGMRATLSMTAIDQLKNSMLPPMVAQIGTLTAADQQTSWGSFFFTVHANIQNIRANGVQVDVPSSTVSCANPQQMAVHLAGIALTVQFDWSITSSLGDQSGSGTATTSGSAADLLLSMSVAADGRPAVSLDAVVVTLNDFQVGVNGGGLLSQLQDWLAGLMTGTIKDSFRAAVEAALRDTVSQRINSLLAEVPTSLSVYSTFAVDLTLAAAPNCTAEFLDVRLDGEVFDTSAPTVRAAHGAAVNLDISADDSLGAVLYVAQDTLNGAQWILWQAGLLHATVDSTMVPSSVPVKLNSDVLAAFLPGLATQFPHRDLQLDASARAAPTVLLAAGQPAAGFWPLDVKVSVLPERQMFLHFQADFNFDFAVETDGSTLRGTITSATVSNIVILQSSVGTVNVASAQTFANALLLLGQNIVNTQFLQKGLALPQFAGGNLLNATVALSAGFAAVTGVPVLNLN